jgi:hypothetical protein
MLIYPKHLALRGTLTNFINSSAALLTLLYLRTAADISMPRKQTLHEEVGAALSQRAPAFHMHEHHQIWLSPGFAVFGIILEH